MGIQANFTFNPLNQKGNENFVVACDGVALTGGFCWALDYVFSWAVVLDYVEVCCGEIVDFVTEVSGEIY